MGRIFLVGRTWLLLANRSDFPFLASNLDPVPHRGRALGSWAAPPLRVETNPSRTKVVDVTSAVSASRSGSGSASALTVHPTSASTSTSTCSPAPVVADVSAPAPYTSLGQSSTGDATLIDDNVPAEGISGNDIAVFQPCASPPVQQRKPIVKVLLVCVQGL